MIIYVYTICRYYLRFVYNFEDGEIDEETGKIENEKLTLNFVFMCPIETHCFWSPFTTAFSNVLALLGLYPTSDPPRANKKQEKQSLLEGEFHSICYKRK